MLVTELLNTSNRSSNKHLLEISCKNKSSDQKLQRKKQEERTFGTPSICNNIIGDELLLNFGAKFQR